jgi:hypothetical protein
MEAYYSQSPLVFDSAHHKSRSSKLRKDPAIRQELHLEKSNSTTTRRTALAGQEELVVGLFLLFAVAFNLYYLYPEVAVQVPPLNDGVLHRMILRQSVEVLASGQDPTDFWC